MRKKVRLVERFRKSVIFVWSSFSFVFRLNRGTNKAWYTSSTPQRVLLKNKFSAHLVAIFAHYFAKGYSYEYRTAIPRSDLTSWLANSRLDWLLMMETGAAYGTIIWPQTRPVCGRSLRPDANYRYIFTVQNNDEADPFLEKRRFVVILYE